MPSFAQGKTDKRNSKLQLFFCNKPRHSLKSKHINKYEYIQETLMVGNDQAVLWNVQIPWISDIDMEASEYPEEAEQQFRSVLFIP
jgi:hypothetical protein